MYEVSRPRPSGDIHSNSLSNCIRRFPPSVPDGPHWWNGPRAHEDDVIPAAAISPGYPGSCPNASSIQPVRGSPPRTSRWKPTPRTALRIVDSAPVRLVFGSL